ncbi:hypothetical protein BU17DRAFT_63244 [Hysterangium stoloniferum]|nr:hypothetical protein BU17DRAFT_63244 [Hysterangium stoloniferum]
MCQEMAEFVLQVSDAGTHMEASTILQVRDYSLSVTRYPPLLLWGMMLYLELANTSITRNAVTVPTVWGLDTRSRAYAISNKNIFLIVILLPLVFASTGLVVTSTEFVDKDKDLFQINLKKNLFYFSSLTKPVIALSSRLPSQTLRLNLRGVIAPVQNFLSAIIFCRFQLDLRERHVRRDDCTVGRTLDQVTLGTFKAATRRVHEAVVDEFGDTVLIDSLQMRQR